jgi:RHH-type rel operon transcriptional repressor/antitoxin RelB
MLAIRLPKEIEIRLDNLAKKTHRTKTFYAREAILAYLEDLEDTYLALERLDKPGKIISSAQLANEIGLTKDEEVELGLDDSVGRKGRKGVKKS